MNLATSAADANTNMVEGQLRPNQVSNISVLTRFLATPRANFTPQGTPNSYLDQPIPYGILGREMFSPLVTARLIQALEVNSSSQVLVVAAGSGYTSALLAPLVANLVATEDEATLRSQAQKNLAPYENVKVLNNAPTVPPAGQYSHVVVDAPFTSLPKAILTSVATGGKLAGVFVPPAGQPGAGVPRLVVRQRHGNAWIEEALFETKGTVHPAFAETEHFQF
jgi:protein-L-isoaspartate(D-aspartate) O-methyltransferase